MHNSHHMNDEEIKKKLKEHRDYLSKRIALVASKNYTQLLPYFTKLLRRTRVPFLKRNGFWLGILQIGMLKNLPKMQKEASIIRAKLRSETISEEDKKDLEDKRLIYKEWIRVFQTITDGMAWRVLDFNRPVIRLLSENEGPGHTSPSYAKILMRFVSVRSEVILINDLTRCLRIGDITRVKKDGRVLLYELKKDGELVMDISDIFREIKKHGPTSVSRQRHRHWTAQMSIVNRSIDIPLISSEGTVSNLHRAEIIDSNIPIPTHFAAIRTLIKKVNKTGFEQQELEEGYFVEITAWDKIASSSIEPESNPLIQRKRQAKSGWPSWCTDKDTRVLDLSSIESFHREGTQYPRNFTPQSVLPFPARDCVRLMMGCLEIKTFLNIDYLKKLLEEAGWKVRYINHNTGKKAKRPGTGPITEFMNEVPNEDFLDLSKSDEDGTYSIVIPLTLIIFTLTSYYKIDFLLNAINAGFDRGKQEKFRGRAITINFTSEKDVLV